MTLSDLLTFGYPGASWSLEERSSETDAQNYERLVWISPGQKPSLATIQAQESAATTAKAAAPKTLAKAVFADSNPDPIPLATASRGAALVTLDEVNTLRQWLAAFKVEVAAATNLANLQTRVASLPAMADRTANQLRSAIRGKIDAE